MRKYRSELAFRLTSSQLEELRLKERERKKLSRLKNSSEETKAKERDRKRKSRARASVNADENRSKDRLRKRHSRSLKSSSSKNNPLIYQCHLKSEGAEVSGLTYSLQLKINKENIIVLELVDHGYFPPIITQEKLGKNENATD
jgi:hypothetical protein